jgi:hypothetical protein
VDDNIDDTIYCVCGNYYDSWQDDWQYLLYVDDKIYCVMRWMIKIYCMMKNIDDKIHDQDLLHDEK